MVRIDDGGKNGSVSVSNTQRLDVSARSADRTYYESRDEGSVYTLSIEDAGAVANEETVWLKNTSTTKDMIIDTISIGSVAITTWRLKFATFTTQPTGTTVTATNLNRASSNTAAAECLGGAAGVSNVIDGPTIAFFNCDAGSETIWDTKEALRLGQDDQIAIECETSGDVLITIEFHFDSE